MATCIVAVDMLYLQKNWLEFNQVGLGETLQEMLPGGVEQGLATYSLSNIISPKVIQTAQLERQTLLPTFCVPWSP